MVVCVVVWNRDSARRRDIILFIAQWTERMVIVLAGISERLDSSIRNIRRHDAILVDRLPSIASDSGIDRNRARLDIWKQTCDAAEHMDVGCIIARCVLSIPSGERPGLDAHSAVVAGGAGIGARSEHPA